MSSILRKRFSCILITFFVALLLNTNECRAEYRLEPPGEKLYKQWTEIIGYTAADLVKEMDPAPEIKPGLVVTPENYKDYPGLKKLFPETAYRRLDRSHFLPIEKIIVTETQKRYFTQATIDGTRECRKNCKVNPDTLLLEGWEYGVPFAYESDNPLEWIWNQQITSVSMDCNVSFDPVSCTTYNKQRKIDTAWKAILGRYRVMGRQIKHIGKNRVSKYFEDTGIFEIGTMVVTYPADIKGMAILRTRYFDIEKQDYFVSYLPGLKRIRVMSGTDSQDPMVGGEVTWDMWGLEWQKQPSKTIFPNSYKLLGKKVFLTPAYPAYPSLEVKGEQCYSLWEKRPQMMMEVISLDSAYYYSRRVMYMDMEHFRVNYEEYYDRRGDLWRTWQDFKYLLPEGWSAWEGSDILNHISERHTILNMNANSNADFTPDQLDMRWLIRMAR